MADAVLKDALLITTNPQNTAQLVIVLRSILRAKKQGQMKRMRKIFYESKQTFENDTAKVYAWVARLSKFWGVHSSAFNILPSPKGLVAGPISVKLKTNSIPREPNQRSDDSQNDSQSARSFTQTTLGDSQITTGDSQMTVGNDANMSESGPNESQTTGCTLSTVNATQSATISGASKQRLIYTPSLIEDLSIIEEITFTHPVPWVLVIEKDTLFSEYVQKLNQALQNESDNGGKGYGIIITVG